MATVVTATLLLLSASLTLIASLGLVRFDSIFAVVHPVTKAITLGVVLVCVAAAIQVDDVSDVLRLILVAVFQVVTAPVASHMVARAAHRAGGRAVDSLDIDELRDANGRTTATGIREDREP